MQSRVNHFIECLLREVLRHVEPASSHHALYRFCEYPYFAQTTRRWRGPQSITSAKRLTTYPTPIPSVDISPISLSLIRLGQLGTLCFNVMRLRHFQIDRWRSVQTSSLIPTTATRTKPGFYTPHRPSVEQRRFTPSAPRART